MKKSLFALFIVFGAAASAQPLAGHLYTGGALSFGSQEITNVTPAGTEVNESSFFEISPAVGYTLTDNWMLGLRFGYRTEESNNNFRTNNTTATLFGRYSLPINEKFYFIPEARIGFGSGNGVAADGTEEFETSSFGVGVVPGFAYFPTTHWSIELNAGFVGFRSNTIDDITGPQPDESTTDSFEFTLDGVGVGIGIYYYFML